MSLRRLPAACGLAGPALFTAAWVAASLRQAGHPATEVQLSGLAADDARDPQVMMVGFIVLGACSIAFGAGLRRVTGTRSAGPWLVICAGAAAVAAGLFRRDHMLLVGPGFTAESWHNQVHDVVSAVGYGAMLAAPWTLGRRFRRDPKWADLGRPLQALALLSAAALAVFGSGVAQPWNGTVQRVAVSLALAAEALAAARLRWLPPFGGRNAAARAARGALARSCAVLPWVTGQRGALRRAPAARSSFRDHYERHFMIHCVVIPSMRAASGRQA